MRIQFVRAPCANANTFTQGGSAVHIHTNALAQTLRSDSPFACWSRAKNANACAPKTSTLLRRRRRRRTTQIGESFAQRRRNGNVTRGALAEPAHVCTYICVYVYVGVTMICTMNQTHMKQIYTRFLRGEEHISMCDVRALLTMIYLIFSGRTRAQRCSNVVHRNGYPPGARWPSKDTHTHTHTWPAQV